MRLPARALVAQETKKVSPFVKFEIIQPLLFHLLDPTQLVSTGYGVL